MSGTFRLKISIITAVLVIGIITAIYLAVVSPLSKNASTGADKAVQRASRLVTRVQKLYSHDLVSRVRTISHDKGLVQGVNTETERQRRVNTFEAVDRHDQRLKKIGRKPDFFGAVDKDGAIIARDLDIKSMYGDKLTKYKNVVKALAGSVSEEIWSMKNKMMRSAAAPITTADGKVVGALVMAYEMTAADAREERDQFGTQVAYFMNNTVRSSSFSEPNDNNTEDSTRVEALNKELLGSDKAMGRVTLTENKKSKVFTLTLGGETYRAIAGPLPMRLANQQVGFVVLTSLTNAMAPVSQVRVMFLVLLLLILMIVLVAMWMVSRHFVNAEDKLELGVAEVINGNMEYTFEGIDEFEGLANAINVMLARLLGRPEPGEEEDGEASWRADVLFVEEVTGSYSEDADAGTKLAAEPEDQYYARIHEEYVSKRKEFNLPVEGITLESLTQKLKANEALLKAKHECSMVRFEVKTEMGKVSLKPIRIR